MWTFRLKPGALVPFHGTLTAVVDAGVFYVTAPVFASIYFMAAIVLFLGSISAAFAFGLAIPVFAGAVALSLAAHLLSEWVTWAVVRERRPEAYSARNVLLSVAVGLIVQAVGLTVIIRNELYKVPLSLIAFMLIVGIALTLKTKLPRRD